MVTTHSPLLLDFLNEPAAVRVVQRLGDEGTSVSKQENLDRCPKSLGRVGIRSRGVL